MLPDLRIVIAAVISTFVLTAGVGFYASSRLIVDARKSTETYAALDATPVNRIALTWPEPARVAEPLALDFAVTANASRNPVRDVTDEVAPVTQMPATPPIRITASDLGVPLVDNPIRKPDIQIVVAKAEAPPPAASERGLANIPEPDIRIAVQYPPLAELPPELRAPVQSANSVATEASVVETLATTGSLPGPTALSKPPAMQAADDDAPTTLPDTEPLVSASRPEAVEGVGEPLEAVPLPKPAPRKAARTVRKKAARAKASRRQVRMIRSTNPAATTVTYTFPWTFFNNPNTAIVTRQN